MTQLFSKTTTSIFYNEHPNPIQRMLDYDYLCKRETPSIEAIVNPNSAGSHRAFFGSKEILIPVYKTIIEASQNHPKADILINFASERSAFEVSKEAIENCKTLKTIYIMAEGVPENKTRELIRLSKQYNKFLIGPATVGAIKPGEFRTGNAGGSLNSIIEAKLYRPGSVGVVTISGGMSSEIYNIVSRNTDGVFEGIAIGGDQYPGSSLLENVLRFEKENGVKMHVVLGEIGGVEEYAIVDALKLGKIKKPLVIWCTGTIAKQFKTEVQFGHAGAKSGVEFESAQAKNKALKGAGAIVPKSFDELGSLINRTYKKLIQNLKIESENQIKDLINSVPRDYEDVVKSKQIRKPASIISSISDERGEEPTYNKRAISSYANKSIGSVINALWFKGDLPLVGEEFIELAIKLSADHGPAVSTAHNSIVTSRAGNNIVMSLIAGLTTIGPRHGGAIDGAANWLMVAIEQGLSGKDVVAYHKKKAELIMGIGHRIKTAQNPDKRVELLKSFAKKNISECIYLDKALEVEHETLKKKNSLILNVDGCIGAVFLDILVKANYSNERIKEVVDSGALNAIFILGRSIGIIGHALDQKRLHEPLYRHDWNDILYL